MNVLETILYGVVNYALTNQFREKKIYCAMLSGAQNFYSSRIGAANILKLFCYIHGHVTICGFSVTINLIKYLLV